jgi:hypothetical protein
LTHSGERVATLPAADRFSFPAFPVDADADARIDEPWSVRVELTSSPCPPRTLPLERSRPQTQQWSVPTARAQLEGTACTVRVAGLELAPGAVIELDAGEVEPRRFAVVEQVGDEAVAVAAGPWGSCAACWPSLASCAEAAEQVRTAVDARLLLERAVCPDEVQERLRALIPPAATFEDPPPPPEPAPEPKPRPKPSPKKRRR